MVCVCVCVRSCPSACVCVLHHFLSRRVRADASSSVKDALAQALQHNPPHSYTAHVAHMMAALDSLVAAVQEAAAGRQQQQPGALRSSSGRMVASRNSSRRGAAGARAVSGVNSCWAGSALLRIDGAADIGLGLSHGDSSSSWVKGVVVRLKELLLESDRCVFLCVCLSDAAAASTLQHIRNCSA